MNLASKPLSFSSVRRAYCLGLSFTLSFGASLPAFAQATGDSASTTPASDDDEVMKMGLFQVTTTQAKGYVVTNSANGFKTNEPLINIPQSIQVITRDMIDDTATFNPTDTLRYAGVSTFFTGTAFIVRGTRVSTLVDGLSGESTSDPVYVDSYQVIKGPATVLYNKASLGGTVLQTTRKPQSTAAGYASFFVNTFGFYRGELDTTGPLFSAGEAKFNYRVDAAYQDGGMYFRYKTDKKKVIDPSISLNYKDTSIYLAYDYEVFDDLGGVGNEASIINYDGSLFVPGGDRKQAMLVPNSSEHWVISGVRGGLTQRFSRNWEMQIQTQIHKTVRGPSVIAISDTAVDFNDRTFNTLYRLNDLSTYRAFIQLDVTGKYDIWKFPAQSTFGAGYQEDRGITRLDSSLLPPGFPASTPGLPRGSLDNPVPALNAVKLPTVAQYYALPNSNNGYSESDAFTTSVYYQETIDIIPKYLTLVGGLEYLSGKSYSYSDISVRPQVAKVVSTNPPAVHRYGAVYHVTKEISLYALYSETATGNTQTQGLQTFPGTVGKAKEVGIKTDLFNGRISSTISVYDMRVTNQIVYTGIIDPISGAYVYSNVGETGTKGFEIDVALRIIDNWQLMAHYDYSPVKDYFGNPVADTSKEMISFFTRYQFTGSLKNLAIGGGFSRNPGRATSTGGVTFKPGQNAAVIYVKAGNEVTVFADYKIDKHWSARVGIDNLLDAEYAMGVNAVSQVDPAPPRSANIRVTFNF